MILPDVDMYKDWKAWAKRLVVALSGAQPPAMLRGQSYNVADVPFPTEDDLVIIVRDETGGRTLATSYQGVFYRVSDGAPIA